MLRSVVEDYITKYTYLNKLYENHPKRHEIQSLTMQKTVENILNEINGQLFHQTFKSALRSFLREYISYLAYKSPPSNAKTIYMIENNEYAATRIC